MGKKKIKNSNLKTNFSNCKAGFHHKLVYVKGWGWRCKYCGKIKTDCTGSYTVEEPTAP